MVPQVLGILRSPPHRGVRAWEDPSPRYEYLRGSGGPAQTLFLEEASVRRAVCALLLAVTSAAVYAAPRVRSVTFLPSEFFVGDRVEMRVVVEGVDVQDLVRPEVPTLEWGVVEDIELKPVRGGVQISFYFMSFQPGSHLVPSLPCGAFTLEPQEVVVSSYYERGFTQPAPYKDPLLPRGTRLFLALLGGVGLGILLLVFLFLSNGFGFVRAWCRFVEERFFLRGLLRQLGRLEEEYHGLPQDEFYTRLIEIARKYLSRFHGARFASATTRELMDVLPGVLSEQFARQVYGVFREADGVRFGSRRVSPEHEKASLEVVRALLSRKAAEKEGGA
ncbi:hypothetical protein STHERM_c16790 [Spirochaeta thermophila DSM 6192]|uniref:Uncharacterized protein n=1 Tax=Winmispira thermophila (strain ATCC 49972 / DSM 6192 / RI 19.B1) TaxID=665571 RepID=E0RNM6_WINT6|nr:hypothetical protein STHERM_c16790 [Spirochaeta thermophila DSM 6192]